MGSNHIAVLQDGPEPVTHERCIDLTDVAGQTPHDLHGMPVRTARTGCSAAGERVPR